LRLSISFLSGINYWKCQFKLTATYFYSDYTKSQG
jgi:hypothetical protein